MRSCEKSRNSLVERSRTKLLTGPSHDGFLPFHGVCLTALSWCSNGWSDFASAWFEASKGLQHVKNGFRVALFFARNKTCALAAPQDLALSNHFAFKYADQLSV